MMAIPALLPILPAAMDASFIELGFALSVFNVVSALVQAPLGFAVDRFGARNMLLCGLALGSVSFLSLALGPNYIWLLVAMALAGIANGVYHPADYALLSKGISASRMGRAFSMHTFAGYLGSAAAPMLLMGVAALAGMRWAFVLTALIGGLAILLVGMPTSEQPKPDAAPAGAPASGSASKATVGVFTPVVMVLTLLFILLNLSTSAIERFSVSALVQGFDVPLSWANSALTAFLFASATGVLAGGYLADRTRHHGFVAAAAFGLAAVVIVIVATTPLSNGAVIVLLGLAGLLTGVIAPSRDMLVRAAAPAGSEGKTFGVVMTGFNIAGAIGPVMFGWLLDHGQFSGVFWAAAIFMTLTVVLTLGQEWHAQARRTLARGNI